MMQKQISQYKEDKVNYNITLKLDAGTGHIDNGRE